MKDPLLDLQAQYASIRWDVPAAITRAIAATYKGRTAVRSHLTARHIGTDACDVVGALAEALG